MFNGCAIWCPDGGRMLEERLVSNRTNERLHAWAAEREVQMIVRPGTRSSTAPRSDEESRNFEGFVGMQFVERADLLRENTIRLSFLVKCGEDGSAPLARELEAVAPGPIYVSHFPLSVLPRHSTNPYSAIDVHAPCRGKAEALRFLAETRGIPAERVIAVGDADNDIPMLRGAGLGSPWATPSPRCTPRPTSSSTTTAGRDREVDRGPPAPQQALSARPGAPRRASRCEPRAVGVVDGGRRRRRPAAPGRGSAETRGAQGVVVGEARAMPGTGMPWSWAAATTRRRRLAAVHGGADVLRDEQVLQLRRRAPRAHHRLEEASADDAATGPDARDLGGVDRPLEGGGAGADQLHPLGVGADLRGEESARRPRP